ncbi:lipocalin-like domain-containing protein [Vibrio renipiscarius]|uniref:ABC transporter n=1 Tax=Vibrio renipiscarius TaxID=1461322 RepID=A0A0C2NXQ8_9VIBR|nr:lipocalin-like domain-containing protein [Vibrio renipiscarius]KII79461.1 ABC transporter [Vibrio renipiscarius]KII80910.1 ABC transporter [Vibrio renipiscarius]
MKRQTSLKQRLTALLMLCIAVFILVLVYQQYYVKKPERKRNDVTILHTQERQVFEPVLPIDPVVLPRDFAFQNEYQHGWWHFFANVQDRSGQRYGIQWSYLRVTNNEHERAGWQSSQLYISHVVISNGSQVWKEQRLARGGIGQAGMDNDPFKIWIDNWSWNSLGSTPFPGELKAETDSFGLQLRANASGPFVLPGDRGYVVKHDLQPAASLNLSAPFLDVAGSIRLDDNQSIRVSGEGWMSKEWGSGLLAEGQQGWDWFVFHLDNETTLSVNRYRHSKQEPYIFGTLSTSDGKVINLDQSQIKVMPLQPTLFTNQKRIPLQWVINVADYDINLTTQVLNENLWLPFVVPYWEGAISTTGSHESVGFMQLAGY